MLQNKLAKGLLVVATVIVLVLCLFGFYEWFLLNDQFFWMQAVKSDVSQCSGNWLIMPVSAIGRMLLMLFLTALASFTIPLINLQNFSLTQEGEDLGVVLCFIAAKVLLVLTPVYIALILRNKDLKRRAKLFWIGAVLFGTALLMPFAMPAYLFKFLLNKLPTSKVG